jgi:ribosomal-protein-alanine N-acetyltransferase
MIDATAKQPELKTERLRLRPFHLKDAGRVQHLAGDKRIADLTAHIPHPYPDGAAEEWIASHPAQWQSASGIIYAIVLESSQELIGAISITDIDHGQGELGYWVGVPYWGQGYCTEAARGLIRFAAGSGRQQRLHARHLSRNPASGRVPSKAGFVHCGQTVSVCGYQQKPEPTEHYEVLIRSSACA